MAPKLPTLTGSTRAGLARQAKQSAKAQNPSRAIRVLDGTTARKTADRFTAADYIGHKLFKPGSPQAYAFRFQSGKAIPTDWDKLLGQSFEQMEDPTHPLTKTDVFHIIRLKQAKRVSPQNIESAIHTFQDLLTCIHDKTDVGSPAAEFTKQIVASEKIDFEMKTLILFTALGFKTSIRDLESTLIDLQDQDTLIWDNTFMTAIKDIIDADFSNLHDVMRFTSVYITVRAYTPEKMGDLIEGDLATQKTLAAIGQKLKQANLESVKVDGVTYSKKDLLLGLLDTPIKASLKLDIFKVIVGDVQKIDLRRLNFKAAVFFHTILDDDHRDSHIMKSMKTRDLEEVVAYALKTPGDLTLAEEYLEFTDFFLQSKGTRRLSVTEDLIDFSETLAEEQAFRLLGNMDDITDQDWMNLYLLFKYDQRRWRNPSNMATYLTLADSIKTIADLQQFLAEFRAKAEGSTPLELQADEDSTFTTNPSLDDMRQNPDLRDFVANTIRYSN